MAHALAATCIRGPPGASKACVWNAVIAANSWLSVCIFRCCSKIAEADASSDVAAVSILVPSAVTDMLRNVRSRSRSLRRRSRLNGARRQFWMFGQKVSTSNYFPRLSMFHV